MRRGDHGEASTQLVLLTPVLLLCILLVVQAALWFHAAHVAGAAAGRGAAAAAQVGGSPTDGVAAASALVADAGATLAGPPVATRSVEQASVTVRLRVPRLVPGFPATVGRRVVAPVERFLPEAER